MTKLIQTIRAAISQRRAFNAAVAEIAKMDARELADLRTDRGTLVETAHRQVYGFSA